MLEFSKPIPVILPDNSEGYALSVESGGTFENDLWCVAHCLGGHIRHYRSNQLRIHHNATFNISKSSPT